MFIKRYRQPASTNSEENRQRWFQRELAAAPEGFVNSLTTYFSHLNLKLVPVLRNATGVSFQYSGYSDYLIRDIGYSSSIISSLLDLKIQGGYTNKINAILKRISDIDNYLLGSNHSLFSTLGNKTDYDKSIVIGLKRDTDSINDIEYIDIFYDNRNDAVVCDKPFHKGETENYKRIGVTIRLYLEPEDASYLIKKEKLHCVTNGDDGEHYRNIPDVTRVRYSQFMLDSTEHHFKVYYDDINALTIEYLEYNRTRLSKKLGYEVEFINQDIVDLIDMSLI